MFDAFQALLYYHFRTTVPVFLTDVRLIRIEIESVTPAIIVLRPPTVIRRTWMEMVSETRVMMTLMVMVG